MQPMVMLKTLTDNSGLYYKGLPAD